MEPNPQRMGDVDQIERLLLDNPQKNTIVTSFQRTYELQ